MDSGEEAPVRGHVVVFAVIGGLVLGMPPHAFPDEKAQVQLQESAQEAERDGKSLGTKAEDVALVVTSGIVSAGQAPLRAGTCGAAVVVAGFAYLLTVFDKEARQGPAGAIRQVCEGPYITTPRDLRGDRAPSP
jgi:hypothetical protein